LGNSFRKQIWEAIFGNNFWGSLRSLGEPLFGEAFDNNFGERLLGNSFLEQVWGVGAALRSSFAQQL